MPSIVDISEVLLELGLSGTCTEEERAITQAALVSATGAIKRHLRYDPTYQEHTEYYPQLAMFRGEAEQIWEVNETSAYLRTLSQFTSNELQLQHLPLRSVTSLKIDYDGRSGARAGSFGAETAKTEGSDFWPNYDGVDSNGVKVCRDGILRSQGVWPEQPGCVKIVYYAGYTDQELRGQDDKIDASPIWEATKDEAVRRVLKIKSRMKQRLAGFSGPLTSENLGDYSYSVDSATWGKLVGGDRDLLSETIQKLVNFTRMDMGIQ